jgi:2-dehydro-3-deoxyphosphogluconate aldolase / (4S)-4-hydroxy-2-oxoglutarate aldolase
MADAPRFRFRTTAILRGVAPSEVVERAQRAFAAGFELVEVPVQTPESWTALETLVAAGLDGAVGAGTVTSDATVERASALGVAALVSPGVDELVTRAAHGRGLPLLPGVMTPSEVMRARRLGHRELKLFPAGTLGPAFLRALRGPFPDARFVAVGGVGARAARDFADAGAWGVGVGGELEEFLSDPTALDPYRTDPPTP